MGANIRIEPNAQWKTLRANSCIDYTKAYTVEDYVPTFILGRVHSNDFNKFIEEYRSRDSTYCQFNDIRSDRRPVVSSPASDNVVPRRFETMREFCSLNQHAVDQAFNRAPSADAFFEALKDLQSSVAFEDSTNPWIDTGPTLPDLANNCPNQIAANEDQAPHAMHGSSNNVVFNWPSYREGLAAARQDIRQAGDDQTLHGDGVYPQPEAHQTNPTLSTL